MVVPQKKYYAITILLLLTAVATKAQPTDNPYRTFYGSHIAGHWTDTLPWQKVFNINDFPGGNYDQKFDTANKIISSIGGGVLYFPAGSYSFTNSIYPANGVILRGDNPPVTAARDSSFAPPSKLEFPAYVPTFTGNGTPNSTAFKQIRQASGASNTGLVYLDINRATIRYTPVKTKTMPTPQGNTYWFDEENKNIIIFGIRSNNVASPDGGVPNSKQHKWQRFSSRFSANIRAHAYQNLVVSNNRLNDNITDNFKMLGYLAKSPNDTTYEPVENYNDTAVFSYTDHYGIHVGRKSSPVWGVGPEYEPDIYRKGNEVCDNWVHKTMRVGIHVGGLGLKLMRNEVRDAPGNKKVTLHPNGQSIQTNYAATYENRGMDWTGWDVHVKHNLVEVKKHRIRNSGYSSVDGEGILFQECCGGSTINGITIDSNTMAAAGGYIGIWKAKDIFNAHIGYNQMHNQNIYCTANTNGKDFGLSNMVIEHNTEVNSIITTGSNGGVNSYIQHNNGSGKIIRPCHVISQFNTGLTDDPCEQVPAFFAQLSLTIPTQDTTLTDTSLVLTIKAQSTAGTFGNITLWQDITPLETKTTTNPTFSWPVPNTDGTYRLFVRGTEINTAQNTHSNYITVTVNTGILNNLPKIALSMPTQDTTIATGGNQLNLNTKLLAGNVQQVRFYNNGQFIGQTNSIGQPLNYTLPNAAGSYYLHAVGSNATNQNATSNVVKITVLAPSAVKNTLQHGFKVYPNPTNGNIIIETQEPTRLQLSDLTGKVVKTISIPDNKTLLNINNLPKGVYLFRNLEKPHTTPVKVVLH